MIKRNIFRDNTVKKILKNIKGYLEKTISWLTP